MRDIKRKLQQVDKYIEMRQFKRAESLLVRLLRHAITDEQRRTLLESRARVRLSLSKPDEAIDDLRAVQGLQPAFDDYPYLAALWADCHLSRYELASVGFAQKSDVAEAARIYRYLMDTHPDYDDLAWIQYQYGRILLISDQAYAAERFFHKALHSPSRVKALTAFCYERLGFIAFFESRQPQRAVIYLDKAIDTYPAQGSAQWLVQTYILRSRIFKDYDLYQAMASARAALLIATEQRTQRLLIAEALFALAELVALVGDQSDEVIRLLQRFIEFSKMPVGVDVTWSRVHEMLGDAYYAQEDYEAAIGAYRQALAYNPYHPWEESIQYRIANVHYQAQNYERAVEAIRHISQLDNVHERDHRIYLVLGNALFALGKYAEAAEAYAMGLHIAPPTANIDHMQTYLRLSREMSPSL